MSKQIDRILLIVLWLLAATLGACFWFNAMFGFNIFSARHWEYISYMQAAHQSIRSGFYISLAIASAIILTGLYILMRPQFNTLRIRFPIPRIKISFSSAAGNPTPQNAPTDTPAPVAPTTPDNAPTQKVPATPVKPSAPRPPRPSVPRTAMQSSTATPTPPKPTDTPAPAAPSAATDEKIKEVQQVFKDAGYTTKPTKKIGGLNPALIAIGTDEQLWIGGIDKSPADISAAIEKLSNIFNDTLDEIEIDITGFIVGDTPDDTPTGILTFADINALREYMENNANPPLPDDDNGNFEAYSEYIDTVLNYVDKI